MVGKFNLRTQGSISLNKMTAGCLTALKLQGVDP